MENSKNLIIQLLLQDMKHEQLIAGLTRIGFQSDLHYTELSAVVAGLMGIAEADISFDWFGHYMDFVSKAPEYEVTEDGHNLLPLAETCYTFLCACAQQEKHRHRAAGVEE